MTSIKLGCKTLGFLFGEVVKVGKGEGEISLADAEELVASGLAEAIAAVVDSSGRKALAEVTKERDEALTAIAEVTKERDEALTAIAEVTKERDEALTALAIAQGGSDGKNGSVKK